MPVKYPCLLWVAFFSWIFPPQCRWFVPSNCVRPSGAGDFAHTTKKRREGGRGVEVVVVLLRGVGISQRRSVRLDAAQLTSQQEHTCAFLADPGRQAGGASVSQSVSPLSSGGESPRSSFNTKTSRTAASGCEDGCLTAFFSPAPRCRISSRIDRLARADQLNQNPGVSSQSLCTQPLGRNLR